MSVEDGGMTDDHVCAAELKRSPPSDRVSLLMTFASLDAEQLLDLARETTAGRDDQPIECREALAFGLVARLRLHGLLADRRLTVSDLPTHATLAAVSAAAVASTSSAAEWAGHNGLSGWLTAQPEWEAMINTRVPHRADAGQLARGAVGRSIHFAEHLRGPDDPEHGGMIRLLFDDGRIVTIAATVPRSPGAHATFEFEELLNEPAAWDATNPVVEFVHEIDGAWIETITAIGSFQTGLPHYFAFGVTAPDYSTGVMTIGARAHEAPLDVLPALQLTDHGTPFTTEPLGGCGPPDLFHWETGRLIEWPMESDSPSKPAESTG